MMRSLATILFGSCLTFITSPLIGEETLKCNRDQSLCVLKNGQFTLGDEVGIVNQENELIAVAEVKSLSGGRRTLKVKETHGQINRGDRVVLLASPDASLVKEYRPQKKADEQLISGDVSLATLAISDGTPGIVVSGAYQKRRPHGYYFVGRGHYVFAQSDISRINDINEVENSTFGMHALGATGGVGYTLFAKSDLPVRAEASMGPAYIMANVGGNSGAVSGQGYATNVKNGLQLLAMVRAGVTRSFSENVTGEFAVQQTILSSTTASSLLVGCAVPLR